MISLWSDCANSVQLGSAALLSLKRHCFIWEVFTWRLFKTYLNPIAPVAHMFLRCFCAIYVFLDKWRFCNSDMDFGIRLDCWWGMFLTALRRDAFITHVRKVKKCSSHIGYHHLSLWVYMSVALWRFFFGARNSAKFMVKTDSCNSRNLV